MSDELLQRRIEELEKKVLFYEQNGAAKLYYALNRKMSEMADMLNKQTLGNIDITDAKDKSFERIKVIWDSAEKVSIAVKNIGDTIGITGDEEKDVKPKYRAMTPESVADSIGELAGQKT